MAKRGRKKTSAVPVKGGWDVLPHNMGVVPSTAQTSAAVADAPAPAPVVMGTQTATENSEVAARLTSQPETKGSSSESILGLPHKAPAEVKKDKSPNNLADVTVAQPTAGRQLRPRKAKVNYAIPPLEAIPKEESTSPSALEAPNSSEQANEHMLQSDADLEKNAGQQAKETDKVAKRSSRKRTARKATSSDDDKDSQTPPKPKRAKKTKDNPYGLTPGESPFPYLEAPSAEQCEEVYRILSEMHGDVQAQAPEVIPAPSLEVTGCGEVPSVLDALIRTMLSGAVTFEGAAKALRGLVKKFGILEEGIGKGSINWNKVRLSSEEDISAAIREAGLGKIKAGYIKKILDMVHQENAERRAAYIAEKETGVEAKVYGASEKTNSQKDLEILKTEKDILSLDHMRGLSIGEAMKQFTKYPGIGVKTSACVLLFCLQQPCFAVDTHVHRLTKWLRWTPKEANENDAFSHLEVRCPDHLKYGLHQLFIRHGQTCGRCQGNTSKGTKEWEATVCPIDHLLDRFDKKQAKPKPEPRKQTGKVKKEEADEEPLAQKVEDGVVAEKQVKSENSDSELVDHDDSQFIDPDYQG
ncbi:DNA glycosylase [Camillea tinctor]|nr:DNA glycosylase [Camillea tinctor]